MRKVVIHQSKQQKQQQRRAHTLSKPISSVGQIKTPQTFKFYVGSGNNPFLVRRVMSTRKQWEQINDPKYLFLNLKWQQSNRGYKYQNCVPNRVYKHCLNHHQFHQQLSNKELLFKNLSEYCQSKKIDVHEFLPITFVLNTQQSTYQTDQAVFLSFWKDHKPSASQKIVVQKVQKQKKEQAEKIDLPPSESIKNASEKTQKTQISYKISSEKVQSYVLKENQEPDPQKYFQLRIRGKTTSMHSSIRQNYVKRPNIPLPFLEQNSKYLWILKPTSYNRGTGIHVFNSLRQLEGLMNRYLQGYIPQKPVSYLANSSQVILRKSFRIKQASSNSAIRSSSFVVQKYLQRPLLFEGRKFDIRVWVLLTHELQVYLFKQGYMRLSSYQYKIDGGKLDDGNVHLTNNAVQKHNGNYGKFEPGNQLSFRTLSKIITDRGKSFDKFMEEMKAIVRLSMLSVKKKINRLDRNWCFELMGYDFMLDSDCKLYLIEVNTNPCIEESSPILQELLPRMLDDAFCLTIDKIFDSPKNSYSYVVQNQSSSQNLWQFIVDLKKTI